MMTARQSKRVLYLLTQQENGQALVEMAVVVMMLILLLGGVVEFGRILNASITVVHSSREAARVGILGKDDDEIIRVAKESAGGLDPARLVISIEPPMAERVRGRELTVEVGYPVDVVIPIIANIVQSPFLVRGRTTMRIE